MENRTPKKNLTSYQIAALENLRARLDVDDPAFCGSDEIREALKGRNLSIYMPAVFGLIELALFGEGYHGEARYAEQDAARARTIRAKAKKEPE